MKKIFISLGLIALAFSFWVEYHEKSSSWLAFSSFMALMFFANLDVISKFKFFGFSAETREAKKVVEEGRATIKELKLLAKTTAKATLLLIQAEGRWGGGLSYNQKIGIKETIVSTIKDLDITKEEQQEIMKGWHIYEEVDYTLRIREAINKLPGSLPKPLLAQREKWRNVDVDVDERPTPEEFEAFLDQAGISDGKLRGLIEDYKYYKKERKHRCSIK